MDTEFLAQFRRLGRIVVVSAVSGVMLGALGMFALVPSRTADVARAATKLIVDEIGIEPAAAATTMPTAALAGAPSAIEDTQAPATKADGFAERWASTRAGKTCKEGTWPYFDSECLWTASQKKRHARVPLKQRHVRVAPDSEQAAPTTGAEPSASTAAPSPAPTRTSAPASKPQPQKIVQTSKAKPSAEPRDLNPLGANATSFAEVPAPVSFPLSGLFR